MKILVLHENHKKVELWGTYLPPFGQSDVGVLGQIWDAIGNDKASCVEGWKGESGRPICWSHFTQKALTDGLIDTETVHGPVLQCACPQSQVGHQALCTREGVG